jgi:serine phosphatase RsbU (regulator of sigma subunit)
LGERVSGDLVVAEQVGSLLFLAVADVLGHGPEAHAVAEPLANFITNNWMADVARLLSLIDEHLRGSRGAAATVAVLDTKTRELRSAGCGNTVLRLFSDGGWKRAVSRDGVLGSRFRTPLVETHGVQPGTVAVFHSDGISSSWETADYPQIRYQSAQAIARTLVRRFSNPYDDASCLVFRA